MPSGSLAKRQVAGYIQISNHESYIYWKQQDKTHKHIHIFIILRTIVSSIVHQLERYLAKDKAVSQEYKPLNRYPSIQNLLVAFVLQRFYNRPEEHIIKLAQLKNTYFIITNLFMEDFEVGVLEASGLKLKLWLRTAPPIYILQTH